MKRMRSGWDFGELFDENSVRHVFSVSEITASLRRVLEREWPRLWIRGEITNLRLQSSGHAYFSLKDAGAQIQCVLFRGEATEFDRGVLRDGQGVVVGGSLTVYEVRGQYQLRVTDVELAGAGALQLAFEKLKQKLAAEGLFAPERKRPLPRLPGCIGIVTSATGAALRDVVHVIERRAPGLRLILVACRVQGAGAAGELAAGIELLNEFTSRPGTPSACPAPEFILLTRGGGSIEDLWAFNEEVLARALFHSKLPVVSAVGHEIDFTISDFVADVRAATPSAAAEIITEGLFASRQFVAEAATRLRETARTRFEAEREQLELLRRRLTRNHPQRRLNEQAQRLDDASEALSRSVRTSSRIRTAALRSLAVRLAQVRPAVLLTRRGKEVEHLATKLRQLTRHRLDARNNQLRSTKMRLELLSPRNVLQRGYSITLDANSGAILRTAGAARPGQRIVTRLKHGQLRSTVEEASD